MFGGFFAKVRHTHGRGRRAFAPLLEQLECRDTPTAPVITSLSASFGSGQQVTLSGHVSAADPTTCSVYLMGPVQAQVTPDANGDFTYQGDALSLGTVDSVAVDSVGNVSGDTTVALAQSAPILSLSASSPQAPMPAVNGHVTGPDPQHTTVYLTGAVQGQVTPDANGNFSYAVSGSLSGNVLAVAVDAFGQLSGDQMTELAGSLTNSSTGASIGSSSGLSTTLQVTNDSGVQVTLTGHVNATDPTSCTVTFSGVVTGSATPDANGDYSYTGSASGSGTVSAVAEDSSGNTSAAADATVTISSPVIQNFTASEDGPMWTFSGQVSGCTTSTTTVTLGGLPSLQGVTASVQDNGWFYAVISLNPNDNGTATASATDSTTGDTSDTVSTPVWQS